MGKYEIMNFRGSNSQNEGLRAFQPKKNPQCEGQNGQENKMLAYHREGYQKPWN